MATLFDGSKTELTIANLKANTRAFAHRASQSEAEYLQIQTLAEYINGGAAVATIQGSMVGDGATDNLSSWDSLISAYDHVVIPAGNFLFSEPMDIPQNKVVLGLGGSGALIMSSGSNAGTIITGTAGQAAVMRIDNSGGTARRNMKVAGFILAGASTDAMYCSNVTSSTLDNIEVGGFTGTNGFNFELNVFNNTISNLFVANSTITGDCYYCGPFFNANICNMWLTSQYCTNNIHIGGGAQSTFNNLTGQVGKFGLFLEDGNSHTFNSLYTENVMTALKVGVVAGGLPESCTFNSCSFANPGSGHADYADRITCVDLQNAYSMTFVSCDWGGVFQSQITVTASFSGGGGSGATALVRTHPDGNIHSIHVLRGGSGYSSPPTVTISGGGGTGATATAVLSGDEVASVTVDDGGSGYVYGDKCPSAVRFHTVRRITIIDPNIRTFPGEPAYPNIVRDAGADTKSRILIIGAQTSRESNNSALGEMKGAQGLGYQHYIEELTSSGTIERWSYVPPEMTT